MGLSLGDLLDPQNIFGGDKGDIVNNILDPIGGVMQNFDIGQGSDWGQAHQNASDWMDSMADTNSVIAQRRWKGIYDNPERLAMSGGDLYSAGNPVGTRLNNEIFHREDKPLWDIYGGKTPQDYQAAEDQGINTSASQGLGSIGSGIGKGFLNAYTFGVGSTVADSLNNWGNYDNAGAEDTLKKGAQNYALNYVANTGMDSAGNSIGNTGGYSEQGGGYVGNNEYGGTGGFNLGKTVGAGSYAPAVNSIAKGAVGGAIGAASQGGNSSDISKGAATGATMQGVKQGATMLGDYFNSPNEDKPYGMSPSTIDMRQPEQQSLATMTAPNAPAERPYGSSPAVDSSMPSYSPAAPSGMKQAQSVSPSGSPVDTLMSTLGIGGGGGNKGSNFGNYADLAGSIYGMYNARKQRQQFQQQQDSLQNLFSPNSPYAQQMRQSMARKDAAAGRNSQYGPRETQLAALLAEHQARSMPQQMQYAGAIGGMDNMFANNALRGSGQLWQMFNPPKPYQGAFGSSGIPFRPDDGGQ